MLVIQIRKSFSNFRLNINLSLEKHGPATVFFGSSGSGKTLTMQCLAGLVNPDSGRIEATGAIMFDSVKKLNLALQKRAIGYRAQDYAMFPHLTVLQNMAFPHSGLFGRIVSKRHKAQAMALLKKFHIAHLWKLYPAQISGGQKQRAALARALNSSPSLLLLDETFSALDPLLRQNMRAETRRILEGLDLPAIIITHDPEDVETFAGSLALFQNGSARIMPDWKEQRAKFQSASACLRFLTEEMNDN